MKASPAKRVSSKRSSTAAASAPIPPAASAARAGAARSGVSGAASTLRDKPRDSLTELLHRSAAVDQHCKLSEVRGQLAV